ncbi:DUF1540 domain-containing protein [uncultured Rummeliibacillus sp.]|uniref:DUF1540 domain-containing protein n=1 Tax=uncultured Rummeliibacillus sp. TaxID=762292 RepID=UPI002616BF27|nr:DUF1540 domain-containing protein [uncultured Rummeliibacillus sp.]
MPNIKVKCTVSDCFFHAEGNVCGAEKIEVQMDQSRNRNAEFAEEFDLKALADKANHSADTCCKTFKPKMRRIVL